MTTNTLPKRLRTPRRLMAIAVSAAWLAHTSIAHANPAGMQVVGGTASLSQIGKVLTVTNSTGAILNWNQFNIAAGETTRFVQSSVSSAVLNRVLSSDPSLIYGTLSSNGKVWLINPAGILVGASGRVDTAGFVASTLGVSNHDFLANRLNFQGSISSGQVTNEGTLTTPSGGSIYLIGATVSNSGIITTPKGETILAAGESVRLVDTGTPGVTVEITGSANRATNLGDITAEAGRIGIAGALVANSGKLNASSVVEDGGRIFLRATKKIELADTSKISADGLAGGSITTITRENGQISGELVARGEISAQSNTPNGRGGFVETSAAAVKIEDDLIVNTGGGQWLIDPLDFTIGAGNGSQTTSGIGATTLQTALGSGSVTIQTDASTVGNGDIFVNSAVTWSANSLTLQAHRNIDVNANLTASGTGSINLRADDLNTDGVGKIQQNSSSIISQAAGTITLRAGDGIVATVNGANNVLDAQTSTGSISLNHGSGTLAINTVTSLGSLTLGGGTLTGSGAITIPNGGALNWTGGTLDATVAGTVLTTASGSTVTLTAGALGVNRVWGNSGVITKANGGCCANFTLSGTLNNLAGGVFTLNDSVVGYGIAGAGIFNNSGTFNKTQNGAAVSSPIAPVFNNLATGVVNLNSGTLTMNGAGTDIAGSSYNVASGTMVQFIGSHTIPGSISGGGNVQFGGNNQTHVISGDYNISGVTDIWGDCCGTTSVSFTGNVLNVGTTLTVGNISNGASALDFSGIATGEASGFANLTSITARNNLTFKTGTNFTALSSLAVSGGTTNLGNQPVTLTSLNLSGGTLTGSGAITIPNGGALNWSLGTLDATVASTLLTTASGSTTALTKGALAANRTWNNSGAITEVNLCCSVFSINGTLNNLAGGGVTLNDSLAGYGQAARARSTTAAPSTRFSTEHRSVR
ncbi:MAG: filamentous hemagglutinin N-terminal domain-containing protein [Rhodocyclaceae bacterium]|nr:filamentous hemagglutinin N-terminal domain-containing protein [Rhodocyclaceae bacterium]